jgi:hypothetical protein
MPKYHWPDRRLPACKAPAFARSPFQRMHPHLLHVHTLSSSYMHILERAEVFSGLEQIKAAAVRGPIRTRYFCVGQFDVQRF